MKTLSYLSEICVCAISVQKNIPGGCHETVDRGYHQQGVRLRRKRLTFYFTPFFAA